MSQQIRTARIAKELKQINCGSEHHGMLNDRNLSSNKLKLMKKVFKFKDSAVNWTKTF